MDEEEYFIDYEKRSHLGKRVIFISFLISQQSFNCIIKIICGSKWKTKIFLKSE